MWKLLRIIILLFLMIPVISWICWKFKDKVQMNLLVVDKTVPNGNYSEHLSFFWVANQKRWVKPNGEEYNFAEDFYGFHPGDDGRYVIKDLRIFEKQGLSALADSLDLAFFADTYGIYNSNWKDHPDYGKDTISLFYGGLQPAEFNLIREMKRKGKTIIAEFNFIAAPTSELVRNQTEQLLGLKWSGWVGKYYHTLDTVLDPEIPRWLPDLYKKNYKGGIMIRSIFEMLIELWDDLCYFLQKEETEPIGDFLFDEIMIADYWYNKDIKRGISEDVALKIFDDKCYWCFICQSFSMVKAV